ncbi:MAG: hypothetical protein LBN24_09910 [Mediterranea sp.]|jgi:hypothetical protein|nr:hypothetical protein [Mediterranea sp.]
MTLFEIVNFNKELLNRLIRVGFRPEDCKWVELYSEYERLRRDGEKVTYIVSLLSEKYHVCERKVYGIIKRFQSDCTSDTV